MVKAEIKITDYVNWINIGSSVAARECEGENICVSVKMNVTGQMLREINVSLEGLPEKCISYKFCDLNQ